MAPSWYLSPMRWDKYIKVTIALLLVSKEKGNNVLLIQHL